MFTFEFDIPLDKKNFRIHRPIKFTGGLMLRSFVLSKRNESCTLLPLLLK